MESSGFEAEEARKPATMTDDNNDSNNKKNKNKKNKKKSSRSSSLGAWPRKNKVTLEGYIEPLDHEQAEGPERINNNGVGRTKSLTDEDLEELKGCLDLGFGFSYDEIPELCSTLPALELCYSMSQRYLLDDHHHHHRSSDANSSDQDSMTSASSSSSSSSSTSSPMVANWKISSPGDDPDEVKARLKYWAQAVACTVRLCS